MAYLEKSELSSVIRDYQLDAITDGDDQIVDFAIAMAIAEIGSILTPSNQKVWDDGRLAYDVPAIFAQAGEAREPLMLGNTKTVTLWHLIGLCNTGLVYKDVQDRYDRTISYIKGLANGTNNSPTLPKVAVDPPDTVMPYQFGSNPKFNSSF